MQRVSQLGILIVVILIPIVLFSILLTQEGSVFPFIPSEVLQEKVRIGNVVIPVSFADTEEERRAGLSGVESLPSNEGLLFVFSENGLHGIWMRNMRFPIDIIWIGSNLRVVDIQKNATPDSYPTVFYPQEAARYILEVNAFLTEARGIEIGDEVTLPDNLHTDIP